jgi:tetratricopeptide (TPR) repeat protein
MTWEDHAGANRNSIGDPVASSIALRTRIAARVVGFFARPLVHQYKRPVAGATILWAGYTWNWRGSLDTTMAIACGVVAFLWAARKLAYRETRDLPTRYYDAFARSDADELVALRSVFVLYYSDADERAAYENMWLAEEMLVRKRWAESRAAFEQARLRHFSNASRAVILNNLAYVTARNGDPTGALEIIERAYAEADKSPNAAMLQAIGSLHGTKGIALTLAGRHEEAVPLLELGAETGSPRSRSERLYWLGRVHRILGREDEAREAFGRAVELEGPCTEEARSALAEATPFRG